MKNHLKKPLLLIKDLKVKAAEKEVLQGINLAVREGELHALMGPNGSGKSSLALALAGHQGYPVSRGRVLMAGRNLLKLSPEERAKAGLFLAFQYPAEVAGVSLGNLLRAASGQLHGSLPADNWQKFLQKETTRLRLDADFLRRGVNEGFSGGEKKKAEILQLLVLQPKLAILDEPDSGLDIDALKRIAESVNFLRQKQPSLGIILITHYFRILHHLRPDFVHVMIEGKIVKRGGAELAEKLEERGYDWLKSK